MIAHPIYMIYQFSGPMKVLDVELKRVTNRWPWLPGDEVDITLESEAGYANIKLSANTEKYNFMILYGSKRMIYIEHRFATDLQKTMKMRGVDQYVEFLTRRVKRAVRARLPLIHAYQTPHGRNIQSFIDYVRGDTDQPPVSWEEAFNTLELTLAIGDEMHKKTAMFE
jgi:hypothetical protein